MPSTRSTILDTTVVEYVSSDLTSCKSIGFIAVRLLYGPIETHKQTAYT